MFTKPQDVHSLTILCIRPGEFSVYCENKQCDFTETTRTRIAAKDACFKHLRQIISLVS